MGQYYKVVNTTKKQVMIPHSFGSGAKLMEFSSDGMSIMQGLAVLLADGNGRGGGDLNSSNSIVGSWAGDQIVVAGDYADEGNFVDDATKNLYEVSETYEDISFKVIEALCDDKWYREDYYNEWKNRGFQDWNEERQLFKEKMFGKQKVEDNA
jgi:hypothetical protein